MVGNKGLGFRVSREEGNVLCRYYIEVTFPYFLLAMSKMRVGGKGVRVVGGVRSRGFAGFTWFVAFTLNPKP